MRGSLTFSIQPGTQAIQCKADLYEMTDTDLIRIATALQEQSFKLQMTFLEKKVKELQSKQAIIAASNIIRLPNGK